MSKHLKSVKSLLQEIPGCALIVNKENGRIAWSNHAANTMFKESLPGDQVSPDVKMIFNLGLEELKALTKWSRQTIRGKSYEVKAIDYDSNYCIVIAEDTNIQTNLKIRCSCLEEIVNNISDGVIMSNSEGKLVLYNRAQEKMENLEASEILGKYMWDVYGYHNPELSEHRQVYKTRKPIISSFKAHAVKNGTPKYVSYNTYPLIVDGKTTGVYSISKNETTLKSLLQETIELKSKLYEREKAAEIAVEKNNGTRYEFSDIKTASQEMKQVIKEAQDIAWLNSSVLVVGETGTGKELFAQSIHNHSNAREYPFLAINCAAIPENLLESTLFGTAKGAFTGAADRAGLIEQAGKGTLFLDEITAMSFTLQAKLLRVIEDKYVRRVGGNSAIPISCRFISATNEDPLEAIKKGCFRQDLFYRISAAYINIPPLRNRPADINYIVNFFVKKHSEYYKKNVNRVSPQLLNAMLIYSWPGNVRELEHMIEAMVTRAAPSQEELDYKCLNSYAKNSLPLSSFEKNQSTGHSRNNISLTELLRSIEKQQITEALIHNNGNVSRAAKSLGIIRQSLIYRMKKLNINLEELL